MLIECDSKSFENGKVYLLRTEDDYPIEVTDTFLPFYTKDAASRRTNKMMDGDFGDRSERWMVGVSVMSGCPVRCKFCATGKLKKWRNLTSEEMVSQVEFILNKNKNIDPTKSKEFKINWTRMGEPFLNIENVKEAMNKISSKYTNVHHYVSTIGIKNSDFSFVKVQTTLQFSLHSFIPEYRDWLIPFTRKMEISELGKVETKSNLKTTLNLTLARPEDFDINELVKHFPKDRFFVKLSPINTNDTANGNNLTDGVIPQQNIR